MSFAIVLVWKGWNERKQKSLFRLFHTKVTEQKMCANKREIYSFAVTACKGRNLSHAQLLRPLPLPEFCRLLTVSL